MAEGQILAYHDRSDGGLFVTLCEMAFASRCGLEVDLGQTDDVAGVLFSEEAGAVIQVRQENVDDVMGLIKDNGLGDCVRLLGGVSTAHGDVRVSASGRLVFSTPRLNLHRAWSEVSWRMQTLRDNPDCALEEYDRLLDVEEARLPFDRDTRRVSDRLRALLLEVLARPDLPHQPDPEVAAADVLAIIKGMIDAAGERGEGDQPLLVRRVRRAVDGYLNSSDHV